MFQPQGGIFRIWWQKKSSFIILFSIHIGSCRISLRIRIWNKTNFTLNRYRDNLHFVSRVQYWCAIRVQYCQYCNHRTNVEKRARSVVKLFGTVSLTSFVSLDTTETTLSFFLSSTKLVGLLSTQNRCNTFQYRVQYSCNTSAILVEVESEWAVRATVCQLVSRQQCFFESLNTLNCQKRLRMCFWVSRVSDSPKSVRYLAILDAILVQYSRNTSANPVRYALKPSENVQKELRSVKTPVFLFDLSESLNCQKRLSRIFLSFPSLWFSKIGAHLATLDAILV